MPTRVRPITKAWLARCVLAASLLAASTGRAQSEDKQATASHSLRRVDASAIPALGRTIALDLRSVSVDAALREIARRADLPLTYSSEIIPDRRVSLVAGEIETVAALRQVLRNSGLEIMPMSSGQVVVVRATPVRRGSRPPLPVGTVTGRVTATPSGEPVPSATVTMVGTRLGATTAPDGRYTIVGVPDGEHWVRAQRLGFGVDSQRVTVADAQTVTADFSLRALAMQLSAVVSIGYGTSERRDLTGAVASVTSEELASAPVTSIDQALLGRAPGVEVMTQSGQPGGGAMVRVRGGNSISASNQPLYVIDGVPIVASADGANTGSLQSQGMSGLNPIAALNPNDIESIEVLKDASTAAIYGARAANGVVLITTKRGRAGKGTITAGAYFGQQTIYTKTSPTPTRRWPALPLWSTCARTRRRATASSRKSRCKAAGR